MKIAVIGAAGVTGSAAAFCIGAKRLTDSIALIDLPGAPLDFQKLDLATGVSGSGIDVVSGGLELLEGASLVIMTASVPLGKVSSRREMLFANLSLCSEVAHAIRRYCRDAILLQVTNPIEPLGYATFKIVGTQPQKIIGYTINDTFRFRMLLADSLNTNPARVEAYVIGEHGDTQVPVFSNVRVDGNLVDISSEVKESILSKIPNIFKELEFYREKTGRTAAWTTAIGIADLVQAIITDSKEVFAGATILQGEYGQSDICLGVPAVIGAAGVKQILELSLNEEEEKAFSRSVATIRNATEKTIDKLEEYDII